MERLAIRTAKLGRKLADEGDAWREYATALLEIGEYEQAQTAARRAHLVYRLAPKTKGEQPPAPPNGPTDAQPVSKPLNLARVGP